MLFKNTWLLKRETSPYSVFIILLGIGFSLFFLRGFGIFDDSVYLKIEELILQGFKPYQDVFDNTSPEFIRLYRK